MSEAFGQQPIDQQLDTQISVQEKALKEVEKTLPAITAPETALPAIRFTLFNFFIANPDNQAEGYNELLDREIMKLSALSRKEEECKQQHKVPTIGTEIEFPEYWIDYDTGQTLRKLGIKNNPEMGQKRLWEVYQDYSYSASVQSRVIQELQTANIIRNGEHLSLHVNIGLPEFEEKHNSPQNNENNGENIFFVNMSGLTFTTPERFDERKSIRTFNIERSKVQPSNRNGKYRFEVKLLEFNGKETYRLMSEIQMMSAALFATTNSILKDKNLIDETDKQLISIWEAFKSETMSLLKNKKVDGFEIFDKKPIYFKPRNVDEPETESHIFYNYIKEHDLELKPGLRQIYTMYSAQVKKVLFPDQNLNTEE